MTDPHSDHKEKRQSRYPPRHLLNDKIIPTSVNNLDNDNNAAVMHMTESDHYPKKAVLKLQGEQLHEYINQLMMNTIQVQFHPKLDPRLSKPRDRSPFKGTDPQTLITTESVNATIIPSSHHEISLGWRLTN